MKKIIMQIPDLQDPAARPISAAQLVKLNLHPGFWYVWTELNIDGDRLLWIRLKDEWNFEGRPNIVGLTFHELLHNLCNAERGAPTA